MKVHDYGQMLKEELQNPEFQKKYEALKDEFEIAKQVIKLRNKRGMTQKELAKKVNTSQSCIARLESACERILRSTAPGLASE
jgi:ribosome-binding protein aMBF1 (putative translation factor)